MRLTSAPKGTTQEAGVTSSNQGADKQALDVSLDQSQIGAIGNPTVTPKGHQQLTSANLATAVPLIVPAGARVAVIQNNGNQAVRWRDDGTAPTSTVGQRLTAGEDLTYSGANLAAFTAIREADGAVLDIAYYA